MPCIPSACDITILYPMGIATMDMHRTLEKERKEKLILLETVLQSCSLSQLSNGDQTSDCIVIEGCGQTTQQSTNFTMDYHRWGDKHRRIQNLRNKLLPSLETRLPIVVPKRLRSKFTLVCYCICSCSALTCD